MHVAALQIFVLPRNAPRDFVQRIVRRMRTPRAIARPFNLKLADSPLSRLAPAMGEDPDIDLDYHVRHSALPAPGGERELGELVSRLHGQPLDRSRPLWTCHVIEGLAGNRFALYTKIHHALADGVRGVQITAGSLGTRPAKDNWTVPWAAPRRKSRSRVGKDRGRSEERVSNIRLLEWPGLIPRAMAPLLGRVTRATPIRMPFEAPRSVLNVRVSGARRVATQRLDLRKIRRIARKSGGSVNDVFLAVCSSALRRHLDSIGKLPESSLVAGVPVSLRAESSDANAGNAIGFLWASLGTDLGDPVARLRSIQASMRASKDHLRSLPSAVRSSYTMMTMSPVIVVLLSGLGTRVKPPMNVIISNVPGPADTLYLDRARMEAIYPVSIPFQGLALNITCVSYAGYLDVGFTGSRDSLPHLQRLAVYAGDALTELDRALAGTAR
jgi:WS/DGAT/MGAT family acyltransferase